MGMTVSQFAAARKKTQAVASSQMERIQPLLKILSPLFSPQRVLGETLNGKPITPSCAKTVPEFQALYRRIASHAVFNLDPEYETPANISWQQLELHPWQYKHKLTGHKHQKVVTITRSLTWSVCYSGHGPDALRSALSRRNGIQPLLMHNLLLSYLITRDGGIKNVLEGLRLRVSTDLLPEFGPLPLPIISLPLSVIRPPDDVIEDITELSGIDQTQEVLDLDEIESIPDPFRAQILDAIEGA